MDRKTILMAVPHRADMSLRQWLGGGCIDELGLENEQTLVLKYFRSEQTLFKEYSFTIFICHFFSMFFSRLYLSPESSFPSFFMRLDHEHEKMNVPVSITETFSLLHLTVPPHPCSLVVVWLHCSN